MVIIPSKFPRSGSGLLSKFHGDSVVQGCSFGKKNCHKDPITSFHVKLLKDRRLVKHILHDGSEDTTRYFEVKIKGI